MANPREFPHQGGIEPSPSRLSPQDFQRFHGGDSLKIGELARRAGLNASAIRYYEKLGLLAAPQRVSGQRRYPSSALDRVLLIRFAGDMGFTLGEIKLFLNGLRDNAPVGPRWKKLAVPWIVGSMGHSDDNE